MADPPTQCKGKKENGARCGIRLHGDYCRHHVDQAPGGEGPDTLSDKQRLFVELYLANGLNAAQAARDAGYADGPGARVQGCNLKKDPRIAKIIEDRLAEHAMSANETLARLTEWGRGTMAYFVDEHGELDLESEQAKNHRHLIKKIHMDKYGRPDRVELYDPKDAVKSLAKIHGLVTDRVEHSGSVEHVEKPAYDYSALTDEELDALEKITEKLEAASEEDSD